MKLLEWKLIPIHKSLENDSLCKKNLKINFIIIGVISCFTREMIECDSILTGRINKYFST
jgi:hypothetical protein